MDDDRVTANTDILGDLPQRHAREDLIPIIARKSQNASNVDPSYFEFFQRLKTGRRCSCFSVETEPAGICPVCYGTGICGGYSKRGTKTEVFDVTYPNVMCANTSPDYNSPTRPIFWSLVKSSVYGTIDFSLPLRSNIGQLDLLDIKDFKPEGTEIQYYVRSPSEEEFSALNETSLKTRLGQQVLFFRVIMKRRSPASPLPKLISIRIAYQLIKNTAVRVDIPRNQESLTLEELGVFQSFSSKTFWLDNTIKNISSEDWFYNISDGTRWKVIEISDNRPLKMITSWDLTTRIIQNSESYSIIPLGKVAQGLLPQNVKSIQTNQEVNDFLLKSNANHLRRPGNRVETPKAAGPYVTTPGQTDVSEPKREV